MIVGAVQRRRQNRVVHDQPHVGRFGPQPTFRHDRTRVDDGERDDWEARLNRDEEMARLKSGHAAVPTAATSAKMMSESPSATSARHLETPHVKKKKKTKRKTKNKTKTEQNTKPIAVVFPTSPPP